MKQRGFLKLTAEEFISILEYWRIPAAKTEIILYKENCQKNQTLDFQIWVKSMRQSAREELMMCALSRENWRRYYGWREEDVSDFNFCKMLFPICEDAEELYITLRNDNNI